MATSAKIHVDFYTVEIPDDKPTFDSIMNTVMALPEVRRHILRHNEPVKLEHGRRSINRWEGDLTRIRMRQIPPKSSTLHPSVALDLSADEGLGEENAFIYDVSTRVLAIQRNRLGVGSAAFTEFFEQMGPAPGIVLHPIMPRREVDALLKKLESIRRINVRVAGMGNAQALKDVDGDVHHLTALAEALGAPSVELVFSMQYARGTMPVGKVRQFFRTLFRLDKENQLQLQKAEIAGKDDADAKSEILDLLEARMVEVVDVKTSERHFSSETRLQAVIAAWERRKGELEQMLTPSR